MLLAILSTSVLCSCAGDFEDITPSSASENQTSNAKAQESVDESPGVRISFHYSDFYSLTDPNIYNCAGDVKTLYHPISLDSNGDKASFEQNSVDTSRTLYPSWIKGVSTDLTDAGANVSSNDAFSCSYGNGSGAPPVSACATFDYGAIEGIPSTMSGTLLIFGGIKNKNYVGYPSYNSLSHTVSCGPVIPEEDLDTDDDDETPGLNNCPEESYALGVEVLPSSAATTPPSELVPNLTSASDDISTWVKLDNTDGPKSLAGAAAAYSLEEKKVILHGGMSPLSGEDRTGAAYDSGSTWIFDLETQTWKELNLSGYSETDVKTLPDSNSDSDGSCDPTSEDCVLQKLTKSSGGRSLHGLVSLPGIALNQMPSSATLTALDPSDPTSSEIDVGDRIVAYGGITGTDSDGNFTYSLDIVKFNPTYGPDWISKTSGTDVISQWMDSYHSQLLNHSSTGLFQFNHDHDDDGDKVSDDDETNLPFINFGFAPLWDASNRSYGYPLMIGGFFVDSDDTHDIDGLSDKTTSDLTQNGNISFGQRTVDTALRDYSISAAPVEPWNDDYGSDGSFVEGVTSDPIVWTEITEGGSSTYYVPDFGGASLVQGFSLGNNELVFFGGVNCREYFDEASTYCPGSNTNVNITYNENLRYWKMGSAHTSFGSLDSHAPPDINGSGDQIPVGAGMAAARGFDGNGNTIIVALGGTNSDSGLGKTNYNYIHYLYEDDDNSDEPTWDRVLPSTSKPDPMMNAALVFSHVTRKFYLFGGYENSGTPENSGDTWELSVEGSCQEAGTCTFEWKQLNVDGGLTCAPDCSEGPPARRSHRMVEVNYNNYDPASEYRSEDSQCTQTNPCSFGIFMEGGTQDGLSVLGDRWMFDPTANGSRGHWQRVNDFPPRRLAAMTTASYFAPDAGKRVHRAILFGGEMSLQSPLQTPSGTFLPPTLGDTHMYDFDTSQWIRVKLLGQGIYDYNASSDSRTDTIEVRQTYRTNSSSGTTYHHESLKVLSPPPLSGAVMVARTYPEAIAESSSNVEPLPVPEIYLFGGRKQDGRYSFINKVYKLCPGSTGEDPIQNNGNCDAYDEDNNPNSYSPSKEIVGRWMLKTPPNTGSDSTVNADERVDPSKYGTFLGAATYDSYHDKIVLVGGIGPDDLANNTSDYRVTQTSARAAYNTLLEYTPNSKSITPTTAESLVSSAPKSYHGYWSKIPECTGSETPTGRYGHSLSYDTLNRQLVMLGGYDINGDPLEQSWYEDGVENTSIKTPQVWTATRNTDDSGNPCYTWKQLTTFGNSIDENDSVAPLAGMGHFAHIFVPSTGYNTGYYTLLDSSCSNAGPIASDDTEINKLLAGGIYIDIDRTHLNSNEDIILHLSYFPLGEDNRSPDGDKFEVSEEALFRIHLQSTGLTQSQLMQIAQPRHRTFIDEEQFPTTVNTFDLLAPPSGTLIQKELYIPLSVYPEVDRIWIQRYSGSGIFTEAAIYRTEQQ